MNEKLYHTMSLTGALDIALGIIILIVGVTSGVIAIVNGARLLQTRKNLTF